MWQDRLLHCVVFTKTSEEFAPHYLAEIRHDMRQTTARLSLAMRQRPRLTTQGGYRETTTFSVSTTVSAVCGCGGHRLKCDRVCLCKTDSQARHVHGCRPQQTGPSLSSGQRRQQIV